MRLALPQPLMDWRRARPALLTLLVELVIAILLFGYMVSPPRKELEHRLTTFSMFPAEKEAPKAARRGEQQAKPKPAEKIPVKPPTTPPPPPTAKPTPAPFVEISRADFQAGDISKIKSSRSSGETGDSDSQTAAGPGQGPGGVKLYKAEWYREPPKSALDLYLKHGAPPGAWAIIACRTIENYRVDDCRQLGESPAGLGLSSALRQAAWQFQVRPPRLGGKAMVGAWVSIRFDFTDAPSQ